jgi:thiamine pyrophosphate-dependent acetolactate synthase large subunit-like protein
MTVQGFWTAAVENIAVVYVILNNGAYKVLKQGLDGYRKQILDEPGRPTYLGADFPMSLNLAGLAQDMGVYGKRIEDPEELGPAVRHALELGKPAVLDVIVDGSV